ncbi:MAG: class I SAM-dependent methyltransferase [Anaerolineales bacterium]|nr:class I SAM-dependent methyltransferase [Anaerolineales bacterium]MDW8447951.1 class I SAM-dependent methyltransferase [Anaerolineales bacterium]
MNSAVVRQLLELNRQFYERFAQPFAQTRLRIQPGVRRWLPRLLQHESLLDCGCGNGELFFALRRAGFQGRYLGLDFSRTLLQIAAQRWAEAEKCAPSEAPFRAVDITQPQWESSLQGETFSAITAFAVLHHLPSYRLRLQVLRALRSLLSPGGEGLLYLSNWQFLNSLRYRQRIQPWEEVGLSAGEVEDGDYLLDWREGGRGLRYVHHFSEAELARLAEQSGFQVIEAFYSDGREGNLAVYQLWRAEESQPESEPDGRGGPEGNATP